VPQHIPREVVRSEDFESAAKAIQPDVQRFDEVFRGIEWALARTEHIGDVVLTADLGFGGPFVRVRATIGTQAVLTSISLDVNEQGFSPTSGE